MRLLNARTLKMEYFLSEDDFPPFAILSHTWGKEETDFCSLLSSITRIAEKYLTGHDIFTASIAQRMSWASRRQTTRKEDIAYCLFGIFDINMPSVYGEGTKAFRRLQLAIIQAYPEDHTIYAWGAVVEKVSWLYPEDKAWADTPPKWEDAEEREELGLLASSPKDFVESGLFVPTPFGSDFYMLNQYDAKLPAQIGNTTIRLDLPVYPGVRLCLRRQHALQMAQLRYVCSHSRDSSLYRPRD
ncbi:ankyrin repeat-containing protein [Grosmannia clavigera kw1407]|uniref:Ankyrin repeat-containing protein n=1 Tax=Grosmannia clavigera (strain kw1407 / UAMH 11150) TaxID=655863 RepID=F0XBG5_GROCL|nr:ankyrin repeat-containing protein [Grosmannia clavigera kw1407]EFX05111.1 ankyrin repeat-containing protein [Grosmannia clavigera kw1407]